MLKLAMALFALSVTAQADLILSDNYSGPVSVCSYATQDCTAMAQSGLTFSGDGQLLTLAAQYEGANLRVASVFLANPDYYFSGPDFMATLTNSMSVTITGDTGTGTVRWYNATYDPCDGGPIGVIVCVPTSMPATAFTFGVPFDVAFTITAGVHLGQDAGYVESSLNLYAEVFDANGNYVEDGMTFGPSDAVPELGTWIMMACGLLVMRWVRAFIPILKR